MADRATPNTTITSDATRLTPCEHLDRAADWIAIAEKNWAEGTIYATAAKIAELHIMMADRAEFRGACDE